MIKTLLKPLNAFTALTSHLHKHTETADRDWVIGYLENIANREFSGEIKACWTKQEGLKEAFDQNYEAMGFPYTHVFDFAKFRADVFPMIRSGLEKCSDGALYAFDEIQEKIEVLETQLEE